MNSIVIQQCTHRYPKSDNPVLNHLDLKVAEGEIFTILGPNGAGKTTLMRILTGSLRPDFGQIRILGLDLKQQLPEIRKQIGIVRQQDTSDPHLSVDENLCLQGVLQGLSLPLVRQRAAVLLEQFHLKEAQHRSAGLLSGGMRRKLELALALVSQPRLLFLDEPTTGLDVKSRNELWAICEELCHQQGVTIFLATHQMEEAEVLSDHVCILRHQRPPVCGTLTELRSLLHEKSLTITAYDDAALSQLVRKLTPKVPQIKVTGRTLRVSIPPEEEPAKLFSQIAENFADCSLAWREPTLEELYLHLTGDVQGDVA